MFQVTSEKSININHHIPLKNWNVSFDKFHIEKNVGVWEALGRSIWGVRRLGPLTPHPNPAHFSPNLEKNMQNVIIVFSYVKYVAGCAENCKCDNTTNLVDCYNRLRSKFL